jgi:aldehyde:ferredoxin oxidoreductase
MLREIKNQQILNIDLTNRKVWSESIPQEDIVKYLGGRGLAAKMLYERNRAGVDPLSPDNVLIFSTGTLTGTNPPSSGRSSFTTKSPLTGLYLKVSVGGHVGAELRYAGWDHLVLTGASTSPVYIWINDKKIEIRDAHHLWGKNTREADDTLKAELGDEAIQTAVIGPAGENKVLFACIMCSRYNSASRGGVAAVMGSKNLKAIAIRGQGGLTVNNGREYNALTHQMRHNLAADSGSDSLFNWGTSGSLPGLNEMGMLATRNFSETSLEGADQLSGQYLVDHGYLIGRESCFACSTACHRYVRSFTHHWGKVLDSGPELETVLSLGTECGIVDTESILVANKICNDLGMDTISAGHVISWAMETYERGIITQEQTDGLALNFGNIEAQHTLLRRIASRDGLFADLLANGTRQASQEIGQDSWKWAIQAKGMEQSAVDTRMAKSYALAFAVNPRGPDHLMTETFAEFGLSKEARDVIKKITGDEKYAKPTLTEKRAEIVRWHEDVYAASEALGFCVFTSTAAFAVNPENMSQLMNLGLGVAFDEAQLMSGGRRIVNIERSFNVREGASRNDDVLPWRLMNEKVPNGPNVGMITDMEMLNYFLDQYYGLHGWEKTKGIPLRSTLEELGLLAVCGDIAVEG